MKPVFTHIAPVDKDAPDPKPLFPKGSRFWEAEPESGRRRKYTARNLADACRDYFVWVEANPIMEKRLVSYRGESKVEEVPKMRAMRPLGYS